MTPKVTVLMAVHNGERDLRESIDSVLSQTFEDFELLVVDDASNDATPELLERIDDPRLRILRNHVNAGLTASLNRGLREARGTYIARQDADDISYTERLSLQVAFLDDHPDVALLATAYRRIDDDGRPSGDRAVPQTAADIRWRLLFLNAFAHSSVMLRRAALDQLGGYDETFEYAQDYELWSRIAQRYEVAALADILVAYRRSSESLTETFAGAGDEVDEISRANIERVVGARFPLDRQTAWRLLFGDLHGVEWRAAVRTAKKLLVLSGAFARHYGLSRRANAALRLRLTARLGKRLVRLRVLSRTR